MASLSKTKSISIHLPEEILTQILLYTPTKSLIRFQRVCKSWHSLIRTKSFINDHTRIHSSSSPSLWTASYLISPNQSTADFTLYDASGCGSKWLINYPTYYSTSSRGHKNFYASVHGMLLCDKLTIWNPLKNKYISIKVPWNSCGVAFGMDLDLDLQNDDFVGFKVVSLGWNVGPSQSNIGFYTTRSRSWRKINWNLPFDVSFDEQKFPSTNVNEACHWEAWKQIDSISVIIAFDFKSEEFREILLPFDQYWEFSMIAYKGMLCIGFFEKEKENLVQGVGIPFQVYVMRKYGVEESWSRLFVIDLDPGVTTRLIGAVENGDVLISNALRGRPTWWISYRIIACNPQNLQTVWDGLFSFSREAAACYGQSLFSLLNVDWSCI